MHFGIEGDGTRERGFIPPFADRGDALARPRVGRRIARGATEQLRGRTVRVNPSPVVERREVPVKSHRMEVQGPDGHDQTNPHSYRYPCAATFHRYAPPEFPPHVHFEFPRAYVKYFLL
jgi:hypothetical protein